MVRVDGKANGNSLVQVRELDKKNQRGSEAIDVLQGLNLDVDAGEFVAFMGPSAPAKRLRRTCLGGWTPYGRSIMVAGEEITRMSSGELTEWRSRHVGFIFQMYNLIPVLDGLSQRGTAAPADPALSRAERRRRLSP